MQMIKIGIFYVCFIIGYFGYAPVRADRQTDRACNEWAYYVQY